MTAEAAGDETTRRVMDALRRIVRVLSGSSHKMAGRDGLTGAQAFVLARVAAAPGLSLRELASRTLTGQSTVSEVVGRLVERGLVARGTSSADGRQAELTLTEEGQRTIAGADVTAQEQLTRGLAALGAADRDVLAAALESWLAAAGLQEVPPTMFFER